MSATQQPMMHIMFYVSPDEFVRVKKTAEECGDSVSRFCRTAVVEFLADLEGSASE